MSDAPTVEERRTARWAALLFLVSVALQRIAVPGLPVALLLPLLLSWVALGLRNGVLILDLRRSVWWLLAAGSTGIVTIVQTAFIPAPLASPTSWALFVGSWVAFTVVFRERSSQALRLTLLYVSRIALGLALLCIAMLLSQLVGLSYVDLVAEVAPKWLLLQGFNTTYPLSYGAELYRSNGWIGLEASFVSFQIGVGILAAVLVGRSPVIIAVMAAGMVTTSSGSGMLLTAVGLICIASVSPAVILRRYGLLVVCAGLFFLLTPFGGSLLARTTEVTESRSSASLRAVLPYIELWPRWSANIWSVVLGNGPGSSQRIVDSSGVAGILVTLPVKLFFDFGIIAGGIFAGYLVFCYLDCPIRPLSFALFISIWSVQPGATVLVLSIPVLLLVTAWSPRTEATTKVWNMRPATGVKRDQAAVDLPAHRRAREAQV